MLDRVTALFALLDFLGALELGAADGLEIVRPAAVGLGLVFAAELAFYLPLGFMAVDKKAFSKLSAADQAVVNEVMRETYENFNVKNLEDNRAARDSLLSEKTGIKTIEFDRKEFEEVREVLLASNRELAKKGEFSIELYDEMMGHIEDYRSQAGQSASR